VVLFEPLDDGGAAAGRVEQSVASRQRDIRRGRDRLTDVGEGCFAEDRAQWRVQGWWPDDQSSAPHTPPWVQDVVPASTAPPLARHESCCSASLRLDDILALLALPSEKVDETRLTVGHAGRDRKQT
jgi:hypothetical protein